MPAPAGYVLDNPETETSDAPSSGPSGLDDSPSPRRTSLEDIRTLKMEAEKRKPAVITKPVKVFTAPKGYTLDTPGDTALAAAAPTPIKAAPPESKGAVGDSLEYLNSIAHTFGVGKDDLAGTWQSLKKDPLGTAFNLAVTFSPIGIARFGYEGAKRIGGELVEAGEALAPESGAPYSENLASAGLHLLRAVPFVGSAVDEVGQEAGITADTPYLERLAKVIKSPAAMGTLTGEALQLALMGEGYKGLKSRLAKRIPKVEEGALPTAPPPPAIEGEPGAPQNLTQQVEAAIPDRLAQHAAVADQVRRDLDELNIPPEDHQALIDEVQWQGIDAFAKGDLKGALEAAHHQLVLERGLQEGAVVPRGTSAPELRPETPAEPPAAQLPETVLPETTAEPPAVPAPVETPVKAAAKRLRGKKVVPPAEPVVTPAAVPPAPETAPPVPAAEAAAPPEPVEPVVTPEAVPPAPASGAMWIPREATTQGGGYRAPLGTRRIGREGYVDILTKVPIDQLVAPEGNRFYAEGLEKHRTGETSEYPQIIPDQGKLIVDDGNHRIEAARRRGETSVNVWLRQPEVSQEREAAAVPPAPETVAAAPPEEAAAKPEAAPPPAPVVAAAGPPVKTVAGANAALKAAGFKETLRRGRGYYYFTGGDAHGWPSSSVYVNSIADWTPERVIAERNQLAGERPVEKPAPAQPSRQPAEEPSAPAPKAAADQPPPPSHDEAVARTKEENANLASGTKSEHRGVPVIATNFDTLVLLDRLGGAKKPRSRAKFMAGHRADKIVTDLRELAAKDPEKRKGLTALADLMEAHRTPNGSVILHHDLEGNLDRVLLEEIFHDWQFANLLGDAATQVRNITTVDAAMRIGKSGEAWKKVIEHLTKMYKYPKSVVSVEAPAWVAAGHDFGLGADASVKLLADYAAEVNKVTGNDTLKNLPPIHSLLEERVRDEIRSRNLGEPAKQPSGGGEGRVDTLEPAGRTLSGSAGRARRGAGGAGGAAAASAVSPQAKKVVLTVEEAKAEAEKLKPVAPQKQTGPVTLSRVSGTPIPTWRVEGTNLQIQLKGGAFDVLDGDNVIGFGRSMDEAKGVAQGVAELQSRMEGEPQDEDWLRAGMRQYAHRRGRPFHEPPAGTRDARAMDIADAYHAMEHDPEDPAVKASYGAVKKDLDEQWDYATKELGVTFEPWEDKNSQPYNDSAEMAADVRNNHHLYFFRGGEMPADHPLAEVDPETGFTYNDKLRAVHDFFGHAVYGHQFGERGEENAWISHSQHFSRQALPALTSETKGQNNWVNFGPHMRRPDGTLIKKNEPGWLPRPDRPFAEQKAGLLPLRYHYRSDAPFSFISPNTLDIPSVPQAQRQFKSDIHKQFVDQARQLADDIGLNVVVESALGSWQGGAENSIAIRYPYGTPPDLAKYYEANLGRLGYQYATAGFTPDINGKDTAHFFWVDGKNADATKVASLLLSNGIENSTIVPAEDGHVVTLIDAGDALQDNIKKAKKELGAKNEGHNRGSAEFPGNWTDRDAAERGFLQTIEEVESGRESLRGRRRAFESRPVYDLLHRAIRQAKSLEPEEPASPAALMAEAERLRPPGAAPIEELQSRMPARKSHRELSTRVPIGATSSGEHMSTMLMPDLETLENTPRLAEKTAALLREYPNYKKERGDTPNKVINKFIDHVVSNLLFLHDQMPAELRERAKLWYEGANAIANRWGKRYGKTLEQMAGTIAVLSPQRDWFQNVSLAERILDTLDKHQETEWSDQMTKFIESNPALMNYPETYEAVKGKKLSELKLAYDKAMWIRVYDEAHNPRGYRTVSPEGDLGEFVRNAPDNRGVAHNRKVQWGTLDEIGKAISIYEDGSIDNISAKLGGAHKVRNFYNNIGSPNSKRPFVTIDTHAVAAGLLRPLAGSDIEVLHDMGASPQSGPAGIFGTYPVYAEAYRRAAEARGILPREMQSITWEAVRGLFTPKFKTVKENKDAITAIWKKYNKGEVTIGKARREILKLAGGIAEPAWAGASGGKAGKSWASSYTGELDKVRVPVRRPSETVDAGTGKSASGEPAPARGAIGRGGAGGVASLGEAKRLAAEAQETLNRVEAKIEALRKQYRKHNITSKFSEADIQRDAEQDDVRHKEYRRMLLEFNERLKRDAKKADTGTD